MVVLKDVFLLEKTNVDSLQLKTWLKEAIPVFVFSRVICSFAIKTCSSISPAFSAISLQKKMKIGYTQVPGHVYNVCETKNGWVKIDLTHGQFEIDKMSQQIVDAGENDEEKDPFGEQEALRRVLLRASKNPFSIVKIEFLPHPPENITYAKENEGFDYELAKRTLDRVLQGRQKITVPELEKAFGTELDDSMLSVL